MQSQDEHSGTEQISRDSTVSAAGEPSKSRKPVETVGGMERWAVVDGEEWLRDHPEVTNGILTPSPPPAGPSTSEHAQAPPSPASDPSRSTVLVSKARPPSSISSPSPPLIHVPLPPALETEEAVIIAHPQASLETLRDPYPADAEGISLTDLRSEREGSGEDIHGRDERLEGSTWQDVAKAGGGQAEFRGRTGPIYFNGSTIASPAGPALLDSHQQEIQISSRSPQGVRPVSTLGGEEALELLGSEGSFRRPGVKVSAGPGEEADRSEDLRILMPEAIEESAGQPRGAIAHTQTAPNNTGGDLASTYMTSTVRPASVPGLDGTERETWSEDEMEILAAPPPRSSSITGDLSRRALPSPTPIQTGVPPASPSTRSSDARNSPADRSGDTAIFAGHPDEISRPHHDRSSTSASGSTTSFPSYPGKVRPDDVNPGEIPAEKKEGRGTRLRKKTSKLFRMPSKDKERARDPSLASPPAIRTAESAPGLSSRTSTATSASSITSRKSINTPTRQRFSTAPALARDHESTSPPPHITMTRPSTNDLLALHRKTSRSSSSSSMDLPIPVRRTSELSAVGSSFSEKKGRLSLPSIKRSSDGTRRRQSSDVASVMSSLGSLRANSRAGRAGISSGSTGNGDREFTAGDPIESMREEEDALDEDVFASFSEPRPAEPRPIPSKPPSIANGAAASSFPSKVTAWFTNVMPSASTSSNVAPQGQHQPIRSPGHNAQSHLTASTSSSSSPGRKGGGTASSLLNAARQKAVGGMRYLMDVDAQPDGCSEVIWLMGYRHEFPDSRSPSSSTSAPENTSVSGTVKLPDTNPRRGSHRRQSSTSTILLDKAQLIAANAFQQSPSRGVPSGGTTNLKGSSQPGKGKDRDDAAWPEPFLADYCSTMWCTYRSQYAPIAALPPETLLPNPTSYLARHLPPLPEQAVQPQARSAWAWLPSAAPQAGLTTDSGWGCMLRTGQSMLANALIRLHLGRDFRRQLGSSSEAVGPSYLARQATYVQILSWFFDDPAAVCPFSVHRMALIGKQLGKEIGEWFGPSTAAGAIKTLANAIPPCGLSVVMASDGVLYQSEVVEASHTSRGGWEEVEKQLCLPRKTADGVSVGEWGGQAVLILAGIRLGLDGVNAVYHDSVKALFTFPQSVGIAGGRPASSYYFIGTQADSLFYLDPHSTRPAIPLKTPDEVRGVIPTSESSATVTTESYEDANRWNGASGGDDEFERIKRTRSNDSSAGGNEARMRWLAGAYTEQQLSTFHCDKVKKMPMSGLDPSMLLGFLCRDEADWKNLVARLNGLKHKVLSIQLAPPSWAEDDFDDPSIESFSETADEVTSDVSGPSATMVEEGSDVSVLGRRVDARPGGQRQASRGSEDGVEVF